MPCTIEKKNHKLACMTLKCALTIDSIVIEIIFSSNYSTVYLCTDALLQSKFLTGIGENWPWKQWGTEL